jgi:orotate phosphoribosyltransferase
MTKKEIAEILLDVGAVKLQPDEPFTFVSGIKSPIYCDNRLLMGHVEERRRIIDAFEELLKDSGAAFDIIAGTASAGIPHAAWLAEKENAPMIYIRSSKKEHGMQNKIEGPLENGKRVLVIEDLISTGGSSAAAVEAVRAAGGVVEFCAAIFTYNFEKAKKRFDEIGCMVVTLTNFETLVDVAEERGDITAEQKGLVLKWNKDPENWGK